jgi:thiaminase/transcriptional activator TenA
VADPATRLDGNPYRAWIETYADENYQRVAADHAGQMDALAQRRGGAARFESLCAIFRRATSLEAAFWQMGLDAAG